MAILMTPMIAKNQYYFVRIKKIRVSNMKKRPVKRTTTFAQTGILFVSLTSFIISESVKGLASATGGASSTKGLRF